MQASLQLIFMPAPRSGSFAAGAWGEPGGQRSLPLVCRENSGHRQNKTIPAERPRFPPRAKKGLLLQKWFASMVGQ